MNIAAIDARTSLLREPCIAAVWTGRQRGVQALRRRARSLAASPGPARSRRLSGDDAFPRVVNLCCDLSPPLVLNFHL
jgi:hypothetical protein